MWQQKVLRRDRNLAVAPQKSVVARRQNAVRRERPTGCFSRVQGDSQLPESIGTLDRTSRLAGRLHGRQKQ